MPEQEQGGFVAWGLLGAFFEASQTYRIIWCCLGDKILTNLAIFLENSNSVLGSLKQDMSLSRSERCSYHVPVGTSLSPLESWYFLAKWQVSLSLIVVSCTARFQELAAPRTWMWAAKCPTCSTHCPNAVGFGLGQVCHLYVMPWLDFRSLCVGWRSESELTVSVVFVGHRGAGWKTRELFDWFFSKHHLCLV